MLTSQVYSNKSLSKKLGIESGYVIKLINASEGFLQVLPDLPHDIFLQREYPAKGFYPRVC